MRATTMSARGRTFQGLAVGRNDCRPGYVVRGDDANRFGRVERRRRGRQSQDGDAFDWQLNRASCTAARPSDPATRWTPSRCGVAGPLQRLGRARTDPARRRGLRGAPAAGDGRPSRADRGHVLTMRSGRGPALAPLDGISVHPFAPGLQPRRRCASYGATRKERGPRDPPESSLRSTGACADPRERQRRRVGLSVGGSDRPDGPTGEECQPDTSIRWVPSTFRSRRAWSALEPGSAVKITSCWSRSGTLRIWKSSSTGPTCGWCRTCLAW